MFAWPVQWAKMLKEAREVDIQSVPFPTGHLFLPPCAGISGRAVLRAAFCPLRGPHDATACSGRRLPERRGPHPGFCLPRNHGKTPPTRVPSTHLPQLEGEAAYSLRLEQTEMDFQIAPFFSQAPSYRFLCGGAPGIWNLICTPSTRPSGSQRWRGRSAASTKDGHRWCRLLPALPTAAPPGPCSSWGATEPREGLGAPRGHLELSSNVTSHSPIWSRTALVLLLLAERFSIERIKGVVQRGLGCCEQM